MHPAPPSRTKNTSHQGPRITVTIPALYYDQVCRLAKVKKVSASWVVREAVEKYIDADTPLFTQAPPKQ